jgi:hypothetical protein
MPTTSEGCNALIDVTSNEHVPPALSAATRHPFRPLLSPRGEGAASGRGVEMLDCGKPLHRVLRLTGDKKKSKAIHVTGRGSL